MPKVYSTSANSVRRQQKAAERTNIKLLRYVLDHPGATCKGAAEDLGMSFPNVFRLVAGFRESGILLGGRQKQTGKRGPWSQVITLRPDLGCSIGVDLEATHVRGVILDFANNVTCARRQPIAPTAGRAEIVSAVAQIARELTETARAHRLNVCSLGLALPGPVLDVRRGRVRTELQSGEDVLEFAPEVERTCGTAVIAAANSYCFAVGHHRMHNPRDTGIEMLVLNRFGLAAAVAWNGQLYTGASHYAGDLGLLPCGTTSPPRRYHDVCTGAALLRLARLHGDQRSFQELLASPEDSLVQEWLREAVPAFAEAIYTGILVYNPHRVLIEGIFSRFPAGIRQTILETVTKQVARSGNLLPEIRFVEGDDLMGARGAALMARDSTADEAIRSIILSTAPANADGD